MGLATVPEASVNENCDTSAPEYEIGPDASPGDDDDLAEAEPDSTTMQCRPERDLRRCVA